MREFFAALLFLTSFFLSLFLGSLGWMAFQALVSSDSLAKLKPGLKRMLILVFPLFLLFLALGFGVSSLYPWVSETSEFRFRSFYLNPLSLYARTLIYFLIWLFLCFQYFRNKAVRPPLAFLLVALTATFVSIDWLQSLDSHFRSSAFGLIFFFSSGLLALAFHLLRLPENLEEETLIKLNNIHLAMIGSWAYLLFMQFLIVWSGNIPAESGWYVSRLKTNWGILPSTLALLQFAGPVFLFFFRSLKKNISFTRGLAYLTLIMQSLHLLWIIFPTLHPAGIHLSAFSLVALLAAVTAPLYLPRLVKYEAA